MSEKKILIFGDSFIEPFKLIKDKRYIITKFKGGTLKGIIKPTNPNHIKMHQIINKYKNNIEGIIFFFGSVDIHFSYYYNILNNKAENNSISNIKKTLNSYKQMILNILQNYNINNIVVINPFINPVDKEFKIAISQLLNYHIITHKDLSINNMKKLNVNIKNANKFFFKYSELMAKTFNNQQNNINSKNNIIYINFNKQTINNIHNHNKAVIKPKYKDFGLTNIHLLYKPVLFLFLNNILKPIYNITYSKTEINYFLRGEDLYKKQKKQNINVLLQKTDEEKKAMFTNEDGQIDFYNAEKLINEFYNKYLSHKEIKKTKKKTNKINTSKKATKS
jgi:hypothetical protein